VLKINDDANVRLRDHTQDRVMLGPQQARIKVQDT
jgi:hypothetical protein